MRSRLVLGLAAVAALTGLPAAQAAPPKPVYVQTFAFRFCDPAARYCNPQAPSYQITVRKGTTVIWTYNDTICDLVLPCPGHNVAFNKAKPPKLVKGSTLPPAPNEAVLLKMTFKKPGTYPYVCIPHESSGMTGVVVVTK